MMDARVAPRFRFWSDEQTARLPPGIGGSESAPEVTHVLRNGGKRAVSGHRRAWSRPVIPDSVSAQRLDQTRLGSRQQLREHGKVAARSRCNPKRRVHIDADDVPSRRKPQLSLACQQDVPGLVLLVAD
jgi:hypothetical protein